ncbi:O-antigen ligase family protein [Priestia megaterium]|uniref:O-antigen ligase family protein n=1 Tax=Priestia megaterium TaxID=1404 RepID=UPI003C2EA5B0
MLGVLLIKGVKIYRTKFDLLLGLTVYVLIISTVLGMLTNGFSFEFIGEVRKFYYFFIPILYFYNRGLEVSIKKVIVFSDRLMNLMLVYFGVCWLSYLVLGVELTNLENDKPLRVVASDYAILVAIYTLWCIYRDLFIFKARRIRFRTLLFVISIVILQHNSVWMATLIGSISLLLLKYKEMIIRRPKFLLQIIIAALSVALILSLFKDTLLIQNILDTSNKFNDINQDTGTFGTRMDVWKGLIGSINGNEWLIGQAFGSGYHVWYRNSLWNNSPHSGYVEGLMRVGFLGMSCWIGFMIYLLKKSIFNARNRVLGASIIIAILVYWVSYSYTLECGAIVGCIAHHLRNKKVVYKNDLVF